MSDRAAKINDNQEEIKRRKDHITFFICILLAAMAWLLIKLSDDYSVSYPFKVQFVNVPKDQVLEMTEDSTMNVSFKSDGYNLLELMLTGRLKQVKVDLSRVKKINLGEDRFRIPTTELKEHVALQLNASEASINFSAANLSIQYKSLIKKKVTIDPDLRLQFKSQFGLYRVEVVPSEVFIYGTREMVDSITTLRTEPINLSNLDSDQKLTVGLVNPLPGKLSIVPDQIKINLDIQKYTEFSIKVPIDVSQISPAIKTFPTETTVYYNMFLKDYKELTPDQFKVVPDVKNLKLRNVKFLNLRLLNKPQDAHNARLDPVSVEFIILN